MDLPKAIELLLFNGKGSIRGLGGSGVTRAYVWRQGGALGIGRWHASTTFSCVGVNLCMHSMQDLNSLNCFCNFWRARPASSNGWMERSPTLN